MKDEFRPHNSGIREETMNLVLHRKLLSSFVILLMLSVTSQFGQTVPSVNALPQSVKIRGPLRGALVLAGGGKTIDTVTRRFIELGGGKSCKLVVIPSALGQAELTAERLDRLKKRMPEIFGLADAVLLHARDRAEADTDAFVKPLKTATAVWILGGDETELAKLYVGTRSEHEIKAVADRGGVLGGTSAGAMILSQFIDNPQKGDPNPFVRRMDAFALLTGAAILPHWTERDLRLKTIDWLTLHPGVLIIGIDETAAAIILGNRLEVMGSGNIGLYDGKNHDKLPYRLLSPGEAVDLEKITIN